MASNDKELRNWCVVYSQAVARSDGALLSKCILEFPIHLKPTAEQMQAALASATPRRSASMLDEYTSMAVDLSQISGKDGLSRAVACFAWFQGLHTKPRHNKQAWDTDALIALVYVVHDAARKGTDDDAVNTAYRSLKRLFATLTSIDPDVQDPGESRRRGALAVANALLSMYFENHNTTQFQSWIHQLEGCMTPIIAASEVKNQPEVAKFYYYRGRMKMYEKDYKAAFESLRIAFERTPALAQQQQPQAVQRNKTRILFYWLVAALMCGYDLPSELVALNSGIAAVVVPIAKALRQGKLSAFDAAIEEHAITLMKRGVYMLLVQLRPMCFLFSLQRLHRVLRAMDGVEQSRVELPLLLDFMRSQDPAFAEALLPHYDTHRAAKKHRRDSSSNNAASIAGVEGDGAGKPSETSELDNLLHDSLCFHLGRLIAKGRVRGYVSYNHNTLVLSKELPFPSPV